MKSCSRCAELERRSLGRLIRTARELRGKTQAELAREADCAQGSLSLIEDGKREPGVFLLARIAAALGVKITRLVP